MSGAVSSGSRKFLSVKLLKKTIKKNQTTFLIRTAIESRFAFACVRAVCVIATCIIVTAMDVAGTLVHI